MPLQKLECAGFRNLLEQSLAFESQVNLLLGPNGQGKTNLLEAVYVLGTGKSFRTRTLRDVVQWGRQQATLRAELDKPGRTLGLELSAAGKQYVVDGNRRSVAEYLGSFTPVAFTAESARLTSDPPAVRRNFMDQGILGLDTSFLKVLTGFSAALKQKNRLLRTHRDQVDGNELSAFNATLSEHGVNLVGQRLAFVERLKKNSEQ